MPWVSAAGQSRMTHAEGGNLLPDNVRRAIVCGPVPKMRDWRPLAIGELTRAERNMAFVEKYLRVPEGDHVGKPIRLAPFQEAWYYSVYDNVVLTRRAILSMARKNSKTATIATMVLVHIVGPEAKQNSRICSGARSRKQAAEVYNYAAKMSALSPELRKVIRPVPSAKKLVGLTMNAEYEALSAEGSTAHGGSYIVAILDEVGQIKGPKDEFVDAIRTSQGAYDDALLLVISTQAPTDADLMSIMIDNAIEFQDTATVCHLYTAAKDCDLLDEEAWYAANPALGLFRSLRDVQDEMKQASEMSSQESSARVLILNQRVDRNNPFVSRSVWQANGAMLTDWDGAPVYAGLDLSSTCDLTAFVPMAWVDDAWEVKPTFWLPSVGLPEKSRADRVPYDIWADGGFLNTTPGRAIEYEFVSHWLRGFVDTHNVAKIAFDRWGWKHLRPWLLKAGFGEDEVGSEDQPGGLFAPFGQGFQSMSPALRDMEVALLDGKVRHGNHPVLSMCAANAVVTMDPTGGRKLNKAKANGRIDGLVALAMAFGVAPNSPDEGSYYESNPLLFL